MNLTKIIHDAINDAFDEDLLKDAIVQMVRDNIDYEQAAEIIMCEIDYDDLLEEYVTECLDWENLPF